MAQQKRMRANARSVARQQGLPCESTSSESEKDDTEGKKGTQKAKKK